MLCILMLCILTLLWSKCRVTFLHSGTKIYDSLKIKRERMSQHLRSPLFAIWRCLTNLPLSAACPAASLVPSLSSHCPPHPSPAPPLVLMSSTECQFLPKSFHSASDCTNNLPCLPQPWGLTRASLNSHLWLWTRLLYCPLRAWPRPGLYLHSLLRVRLHCVCWLFPVRAELSSQKMAR